MIPMRIPISKERGTFLDVSPKSEPIFAAIRFSHILVKAPMIAAPIHPMNPKGVAALG